MNERLITPVVLSGGSGTRLWPLSRRSRPKQLLPLAGPNTMIQETLSRAIGPGFTAPIVICGEQHRFLVAEQLRGFGITGAKIILEPLGRNTAPAATIAALHVAASDPECLLLLMPSDQVVKDRAAFRAAVAVAAKAACQDYMVTFGITPTAPETGYGYVKGGEQLGALPGAFAVERFVEKPDRPTAESYLAAGDYYWNSGMFLFSAAAFLAEMERLEPRMLEHCRHALAAAEADADFLRLPPTLFAACPSQSIDYAVMEHARAAAVVPVDMGWNDVGSWQSLWEIAERSGEGNVVQGDVVLHAVHHSYVRSEGPLVAAIGVDNLVIVATPDAVLVSHREATQDVKKIVDELERQQRHQHLRHPGDEE
ncbi:MAG: mannose-1-phosphate guanylyltransferase/mannose-6-phosphate isomerase [Alphaproteobacteria bacterium]|nr:mannose-1-phosphate guanylyltransferase/mannose-6-phosphate isomerase [Alphaproteobacteria bacterium]